MFVMPGDRAGRARPGPQLPVIRGSAIISSSAASYVIPWPGGTLAGDLAVVFIGGGFAPSTVATTTSGQAWPNFDVQSGANWNSGVSFRVLSASDISNGSVTVTMSGTFNTVIALVTFVGPTGGPRSPQVIGNTSQQAGFTQWVTSSRNATGSATRSLSTDGAPLITDFILYFGSNRNASTNTVNQGSPLQSINATAASGALYGGGPGTLGGVTATFSYSVSSGTTGDYQVIMPIKSA